MSMTIDAEFDGTVCVPIGQVKKNSEFDRNALFFHIRRIPGGFEIPEKRDMYVISSLSSLLQTVFRVALILLHTEEQFWASLFYEP